MTSGVPGVGTTTYVDPALYAQYKANLAMQNRAVGASNTTQVDSFVSASGATCTDGKDDGKIGFFAAMGNAIKGVGKTVVNCVKGMFTNKEGKFSLGKTLLSAGTMVLCYLNPAVALAACAVGGVMAAGQVVKGAVKASKATTDAEAKMAWQDIGGGTFGVAMSVVGAKASYKALNKPTANFSSVDDALSMLDDGSLKLNAPKNSGANANPSSAPKLNSSSSASSSSPKIDVSGSSTSNNVHPKWTNDSINSAMRQAYESGGSNALKSTYRQIVKDIHPDANEGLTYINTSELMALLNQCRAGKFV